MHFVSGSQSAAEAEKSCRYKAVWVRQVAEDEKDRGCAFGKWQHPQSGDTLV